MTDDDNRGQEQRADDDGSESKTALLGGLRQEVPEPSVRWPRHDIGTSTVWDEPFGTDDAADGAFRKTTASEGLDTFRDSVGLFRSGGKRPVPPPRRARGTLKPTVPIGRV